MVRQLRLNTLENSRKSYNRVVQAYLRGEIPTEQARTLAYLMVGQLQFWRLEFDIKKWKKELEIEERLQRVEEQLSGNHGHT